MSKHESPPFRMRIEKGRLVPVSAWDQERLATFRNGSELTVQLTQQKNRKLERKYWAILHEVIKNCPVKQRTAEDLHKAIRLKLGVVDAYFTVEGKLRVDVKSTTGMDDPEYQRFFDDAMALVHEITGVDPETLSRETADVGEDEQEPSSELPSSYDEGSGATVPIGAAADPSASPGDEEAGDIEAREEPDASPASEPIRTPADCLNAFLRTATDQDISVGERRDILEQSKEWWKSALPDHLDFVKACLTTADKVAKGELGSSAARKYLEGLL
jgi:hypothetical protein